MLIICMAWLFYALDGSVISVLITNESFNKVGLYDLRRYLVSSLFDSL